MTISDILLGNEKRWNATLIQDLVDGNTAAKILKTPLLESVQNDRIIWRYEKNGIYSVKSAYRYCVVDSIDISHLQVPGHWNLIWTIKSPPKLRNFLWRLCRNCVPTRVRLNTKGVNCPNNCVLCDDGIEDNFHVFFLCNNSKRIWQKEGWWNMLQQPINNTAEFASMIFSVLQVLGTAERSLFAALLWSIWQQRNNKVWKNHSEPVHVVCDRARNLIMEWNVAQEQQQKRTVLPQQHADSVWSKPPLGRYKCNVDASFSIRHNRTVIGICIRDDQGSFVLAKTEWFSPILDVDSGEALGLLHALKWVQELQLESVDFELDSKNVVAKFHSNARDISGLGDVIKDCQSIHNSHFRNSRVEFVKRQANEVAHVLANVAPSLASFHIFIDVPLCIDSIINNEMS